MPMKPVKQESFGSVMPRGQMPAGEGQVFGNMGRPMMGGFDWGRGNDPNAGMESGGRDLRAVYLKLVERMNSPGVRPEDRARIQAEMELVQREMMQEQMYADREREREYGEDQARRERVINNPGRSGGMRSNSRGRR